MASFVENIRVRRFVIDGFSGAGAGVTFCGSVGGAACPLLARLSELGTAIPFGLTGRVFGDPTAEGVWEVVGEGWGFSVIKASRGVLTVAMMMVGRRGGVALGSSGMKCAEAEAATAVRAMPEFWSDLGGQNCCRGCDFLADDEGCLWDFGRESEKFAVVGGFGGRAL
jgi:hypothetical protein